jgi:hypothetical protein
MKGCMLQYLGDVSPIFMGPRSYLSMTEVVVQCGSCDTLNSSPADAQRIKCGNCGAVNALPTKLPLATVASEDGWAEIAPDVEVPSDVPSGLAILTAIDSLKIHQEVEYAEAAAQALGVGYESNNRYKVMDASGNVMFRVVEDTGFCWRCCCQSLRPFNLMLFDAQGNQVMTMHRHFKWCACSWFGPCLEDIQVYEGRHDRDNESTEGMIGRVTQDPCGGWFTPTIFSSSPEGQHQLSIEGPFMVGKFCDSTFHVKSNDGTNIGAVSRLISGAGDVGKQVLTDADTFAMTFPTDLSVNTKATVLASMFLIDFMFFETGGSVKADLVDQSVSFHLCTCYCCGCPCPCSITVGGNNNNGGPPVAAQMQR